MFIARYFPSVLDDLVAHTREEARPVVVIVLRPAVEWMVVAFGALEARTQENLRGSPGARQRVAVGPVVVGGRARVGAASRRDEFAGELVERFVFRDALANPVVKILDSFRIERVGLGPQQIRPF